MPEDCHVTKKFNNSSGTYEYVCVCACVRVCVCLCMIWAQYLNTNPNILPGDQPLSEPMMVSLLTDAYMRNSASVS